MNKYQKLFGMIADRIEADPESYDQDVWGYTEGQVDVDYEVLDDRKTEILEEECGTTHCIAGWAAVLSGYKPTVMSYEMGLDKHVIEVDWSTVSTESDIDRATSSVGREVLGLSARDADILFSEHWVAKEEVGNDMENVVIALRRLADGCSVDDVTHDSAF